MTFDSTFSIKIFFNQEESILIRPVSGEMEETDEICSRLKAVTPGCPVRILFCIKEILMLIGLLKNYIKSLLSLKFQRFTASFQIYFRNIDLI